VRRLQGSALSRSWDPAEGGELVAADTKGGRIVSLSAAKAPPTLYSGEWSWAGAGAGLVAAASRLHDGGFAFKVLRPSLSPGGARASIEGGVTLDCFVSDALFLPDRLIVAGARGDGKSFSAWELRPDSEADPRALVSLPREGGFLRLAGRKEGGLYCFVSARSGASAGPLEIWRLSVAPSGAPPKSIEPRFAAPGALAWFGSGWLREDGSLAMPLSLAGGKYALSRIDAKTGAELSRLELPAPLYQILGSRDGRDYVLLYDHARAPGKFRFAEIDPVKNRLTCWDMP
jgi:hypothetical protein